MKYYHISVYIQILEIYSNIEIITHSKLIQVELLFSLQISPFFKIPFHFSPDLISLLSWDLNGLKSSLIIIYLLASIHIIKILGLT